MSFYARVATVFRDPAQLAPIFLDFCSLLHSLWNERRSGPNFIAPMSSLTKRPSGRLSRLLLQYSSHLFKYESEEASTFRESNPQIVAVIHLNKIPQESIKADLHGLVSLLVFIEILILWSAHTPSLGGDGALTLVRRSEETHDTLTPDSGSCAVLLGEDLTVVVKGPEVVIEAITNGGFYLSRTFAGVLHRPAWNVARDAALQGFFQGLLYLVALLLVRRLGGHLSLTPLRAILLGLPLTIPSWKTYGGMLRTMFQFRGRGSASEKLVEVMTRASTEFLRMIARGIPFGGFLLLCMYTSEAGKYVPRLGDLVQFALLLNLLPFVSLAVILSIPSQNYPLQAKRFLDVLGNPPVKKWRFKTPAAAAIFQCLVLCDGLVRPTKEIDIRGVLDTLILDQRDVLAAWKARVADRIAHEVDISFAPTIPMFRDEGRQMQLKEYLDDAQCAYERFRLTYLSEPSVQVLQHTTTQPS
ncbi:hypothetical protein J3R82DRAFT_10114 [Butyriboletus roseoflavus]|nr:hypothetical protein J3R82DRAFT_10114 [Butyriboletus roseoflavus]